MGASASKPKELRISDDRPTVFNGNSPNPSAMTRLDLSNYVGNKYAVVCLRFYNGGLAAAGYAVQPGYEAGTILPNNFPLNAGGVGAIDVDAETAGGYLIVNTDSLGGIDWYCTVVDNPTIITLLYFIH